MKIAFGNDHAGHDHRAPIMEWLREQGHEIVDFGYDGTESVDYPDYAGKVGFAVADGDADLGVLICGSGIGMSISANKIAGIRAALCIDEFSGEMSRRHNDANVCCLRARRQDVETNKRILTAFLGTDFEGGRHERRVLKIGQLETGERETC